MMPVPNVWDQKKKKKKGTSLLDYMQLQCKSGKWQDPVHLG